jgi:hypothetical protein
MFFSINPDKNTKLEIRLYVWQSTYSGIHFNVILIGVTNE